MLSRRPREMQLLPSYLQPAPGKLAMRLRLPRHGTVAVFKGRINRCRGIWAFPPIDYMDGTPPKSKRLVKKIDGKATFSKGIRIQRRPSGESGREFVSDVAESRVAG